MANWCNARLIAVGSRQAVAAFAEATRARPTRVFRRDMLIGEAHELRAERMERLDADLWRKVFQFQVRNDDGLECFGRLSKRHKRLSFILVYGEPNSDQYGSYLLRIGLARAFRVSQIQKAAVMRKHRVTLKDEDEWRFWEASWELMDIAEAKWASAGARSIETLQPESRARRSAQKTKAAARAARG